MKRGTTPTLRINIPKIEITDIDHVDFVFKAVCSESAPTIITKTYPASVTFDSENNVFLILFSDKETRLFTSPTAYMDTRIVTRAGKIPATQIVKFDVHSTLFSEEEKHD